MSVLARSCCAKVALATAIAMTATAVYPAGQASALQADRAGYSAAVVNVPVLALASLESGLAAVDAAPTDSSPRAATQNVAPAGAEATPIDTLIDSLLVAAGIVALGVGFALWPLWLAALPITFPFVWNIATQNARSIVGPLLLTIGGPLLLPLYISSLFPPRVSLTATATPPASAARSSAASTPMASVSETTADDAAIQAAADRGLNFPAYEVEAVAPTNQSGAMASAAANAQDPLAEALKIALGLAFAPVWYLGALVTVPITFAVQLNFLVSTLPIALSDAIPAALGLTLISWPVAPFTLVSDFVDRLFPTPRASATRASASAAAVSNEIAADPAGAAVASAKGFVSARGKAVTSERLVVPPPAASQAATNASSQPTSNEIDSSNQAVASENPVRSKTDAVNSVARTSEKTDRSAGPRSARR